MKHPPGDGQSYDVFTQLCVTAPIMPGRGPPPMPIYDRTLARMSRRELLKLASMLGAAAIAPPIFTRRVLAQPIFDAYPFTLGVASGDPLPDGVVLWTRLAPKPLEGGGMPMANVDVNWEIARDARFASIVQKGTA